MLSRIHILSVSYKEIELGKVPSYGISCLDQEEELDFLTQLKNTTDFQELYYLSTCNRRLFLFTTRAQVNKELIQRITGSKDIAPVRHFWGREAIRYFFEVTSSVHSMVVGEQEIMGQIKIAYDRQFAAGLTGDTIRLLVLHAIRVAKKIHTDTSISTRSVSVASLAVNALDNYHIAPEDPIILVGAGATIETVAKLLLKKKFRHITIYNRTDENSRNLANKYQLRYKPYENLQAANIENFECLIVCTSSPTPIITFDLAHAISKGRIEDRLWIDLGLPTDLDTEMYQKHPCQIINLTSLQLLAHSNLQSRKKEIEKTKPLLAEAVESFVQILGQRQIEVAFRKIPDEIKKIRKKAVTEVFKEELSQLDPDTLELVLQMMHYMEKKCISIPMKVAKESAQV